MYRSGHLGIGLLVWAPVGALLWSEGAPVLAFAGWLLCTACSSVPDLDLELSIVSHRGPTHTLAFAALVTAVAGSAGVWVAGVPIVESVVGGAGTIGSSPAHVGRVTAAAAGLAVLGHLAGDALTPAGVPLLWPITEKRYGLGLCRAENAVANQGLLVLGVVATALAVDWVLGPTAIPTVEEWITAGVESGADSVRWLIGR